VHTLLDLTQVMGIAIFSPRLDAHGNSIRGVEFCKRLLTRYPFGIFDSIVRPKGGIPALPRELEGTDADLPCLAAPLELFILVPVPPCSFLPLFGPSVGNGAPRASACHPEGDADHAGITGL
jgi:hypothetical protein